MGQHFRTGVNRSCNVLVSTGSALADVVEALSPADLLGQLRAVGLWRYVLQDVSVLQPTDLRPESGETSLLYEILILSSSSNNADISTGFTKW